jgi:hypothetical protein
MANARTAFDALVLALRDHGDVRESALNGKRAFFVEGDPFLMWYRDSIAVRLHSRALVRARAIDGSVDFDPYNPEEGTMARPGWLRLPVSAFAQWERLALEALQCVRESHWKAVSWEVPGAPGEAASSAQEAAAAKKLADMAKKAQIGIEWGFDFSLEPLPG